MKLLGVRRRARGSDAGAMAKKTIRARVHAGHFELLEPVTLPEGRELQVTFEVTDEHVEPSATAVSFATWDLGTFQPLTRPLIYDEVG